MNTPDQFRPINDPDSCPPGLSGSQGSNRAECGENRLGVNTDVEAINLWLAQYAGRGLDGKEHPTWRNYRKEAERLLLWSWLIVEKPLSSLLRADLADYEDFLRDPPTDWVAQHGYPHDDPRWRPFIAQRQPGGYNEGVRVCVPEYRKGLTDSSILQARRILKGLFVYLRLEGYIVHNPLETRPGIRRRQNAGRVGGRKSRYGERHLGRAALEFALQTNGRAMDEATHGFSGQWNGVVPRLARERWIIQFLYYSGARRAEAAAALMRDIVQRTVLDASGIKIVGWWWEVSGKGGREDRVPLPAGAMDSLRLYRRSLGWPPLPSPDEATPLIERLVRVNGQRRKGGPLSPSMIYHEVKRFFHRAAEAARQNNDPDIQACEAVLRNASTHWLRHTYGTNMVNSNIPLQHAQRNMRHSRLDTTGQYLHTDDAERAKTIIQYLH